MSREVAVVSHSHWDREWYASFESYRLRLVTMMDQLIDLLDSDADFAHFHLDGQIALVDDYLAVRPDQKVRLEKLIHAGRVAVGPWYVLMDEFCVSAETIVRNLELGLSRSEQFGGSDAPPGYLPDMFGHISQMPQLLAQAGLEHAVVWRGVPEAVERTAFLWAAPDGSQVRAEYLPVGYANGAFLPGDPERLVARIAAHERELARFLAPEWPLLVMNGGDHQWPDESVPALLRRTNDVCGTRYLFRQTSLAEYLYGAPRHGLPTWTGELRSGARAPILMGVLSSRVDIKQAAAAVETALERVAEPMAALWLPPGLWPAAQLDRAWLETIRNSAHDSICGCSADEVGLSVRARYDAALALAASTTAQATAIAAVATREGGPVVLNPSPRPRSGIVEIDLPGIDPPPGTQQTHRFEALAVERTGTGRDLAVILARLAADGVAVPGQSWRSAQLGDEQGTTVLTIHIDTTRPPAAEMASVMAEAWALAGSRPDQPLVVRVRRAVSQRVLAPVSLPGWGWRVWRSSEPAVEPVRATRLAIDNGLVSVAIDPLTGTFSLDGVAGQNTIISEADAGDTYNFSPDPDAEPVSEPTSVTVELVESGPLRATVRVTRRYHWDVEVEVLSDLEVRAGEAAVRITTSFDHHSRDHRVRAWFPLAAPADHSEAECAFATAVRPRIAEGGPQEHPSASYPSRRFVTAGDTTVTHQGLLEHELVEEGRVLAVTLLRATGVIARPAPACRPVVAGPAVPLRDAQMPGPQIFRYALARRVDPWVLADQVWTPLLTARAAGGGHLEDKGTRLEVEGGEISALYRKDGALVIRVFNPSNKAVTVRLPGRSGWLVDLRGRVLQEWSESFELSPWKIATARLDGDLG